MEDLETVETDAIVTDTPSTEGEQTPEIAIPEEEKELTDEELQEEIIRLKEEVLKEEDAKEKRHKEQDIGWKTKNLKEREKAKALEAKNLETEAKLKGFENSLLEEAYTKTIDNNFGLPYYENLAKTNPDLADKLAKEKWAMKNAKELILHSKRQLAEDGDEEFKKIVSEEDVRMSEREIVYHELALEQAQEILDELKGEENTEAKSYFDEIVEGKKLTPAKAKKYAEMATFYATRNRKTVVDKDRAIADKANTGIIPKSGSKEAIVGDTSAIRNQLLNSGVSRYQVDLMYPL